MGDYFKLDYSLFYSHQVSVALFVLDDINLALLISHFQEASVEFEYMCPRKCVSMLRDILLIC